MNSLSESRLEDERRIQTMEKELLNCYQEIGNVFFTFSQSICSSEILPRSEFFALQITYAMK